MSIFQMVRSTAIHSRPGMDLSTSIGQVSGVGPGFSTSQSKAIKLLTLILLYPVATAANLAQCALMRARQDTRSRNGHRSKDPLASLSVASPVDPMGNST